VSTTGATGTAGTTGGDGTTLGERRLLVDGELVDAAGGATFDNVNPATEEVLGPVADATAADMEAAIAAARRAFDTTSWALDHDLRRSCLLQLQAALEDEREELRAELVAEVGCPVLSTYGPQLDAPLREALTWPAEMIDRFPWRRSLGPKDAFGLGTETEREVWKEPVGVVGVIVPWNFPVEIILNKLGPLLAMGNTCVLKPAPDTPWNATRLGRLVAERTDIPPGVVNVVASSDHLVGEVLASSPSVDMVAFTGSTATGRRIMQLASDGLRRVFLELGGKSVNLVLDDADFAATVPAASSVCFHAGQGCAIPTRLLVPRSRHGEAVELAAAGFAGVTYGDPTDPANLMGPLISRRQRSRVLGYIDQARREGARLVCGGGRPDHLPRGWYVEPTLFADVDNAMTIAREEVFGPVLVVIPYEDDDDAVRIANDSPYGLSGMITSGDLDRAKSVARRIRTGTLGLNGGVWYGADAPFGGYKQSGIGRQCGVEGLEAFTETKTVGWPA
jgi:aldehyde dehydrogenase (NAD+)